MAAVRVERSAVLRRCYYDIILIIIDLTKDGGVEQGCTRATKCYSAVTKRTDLHRSTLHANMPTADEIYIQQTSCRTADRRGACCLYDLYDAFGVTTWRVSSYTCAIVSALTSYRQQAITRSAHVPLRTTPHATQTWPQSAPNTRGDRRRGAARERWWPTANRFHIPYFS